MTQVPVPDLKGDCPCCERQTQWRWVSTDPLEYEAIYECRECGWQDFIAIDEDYLKTYSQESQ